MKLPDRIDAATGAVAAHTSHCTTTSRQSYPNRWHGTCPICRLCGQVHPVKGNALSKCGESLDEWPLLLISGIFALNYEPLLRPIRG
jgi:hypothetical protein